MEHLGPTIQKLKNGRYQIKPPGKNERTGYSRATTITKTLDDQSSLISWNAGRTALGLVAQPHLYAAVAACDPDNKKELYELCEKAAEAGGSATRREQGTAIHKFLERKIEDPAYNPPAPYDQDVVSILAALENAGLKIAEGYSEFVVVNHRLKIAGTADLAVVDANGNWYVADLKTGSSVKYGAQAWAIQLAIYAMGDAIYHHQPNEADDYETPLPNFDIGRAVIIHCEPASGKTNLYWIDLETGRKGLELALAVREQRNAKPLQPFSLAEATTNLKTTAAPVEYIDELWRTIITERIKNILQHPDAAADLQWPVNIPTLKSGEPITVEQSKTISEILSLIEKIHQLPFMQTEPPKPKPAPVHQEKPQPVKTEPKWTGEHNLDKAEDPKVTDEDIAGLRVQIDFLTDKQRRWAQTIMEELRQESLTIALLPPKGAPYLRRWNLTATILNLAPIEDEDLAKAVVKHCTKRPFKTLAKGLGNLTLKQSQKAFELSQKIALGDVTIYYHEDGVVTFSPKSDTN
jgi:hypothetical protein